MNFTNRLVILPFTTPEFYFREFEMICVLTISASGNVDFTRNGNRLIPVPEKHFSQPKAKLGFWTFPEWKKWIFKGLIFRPFRPRNLIFANFKIICVSTISNRGNLEFTRVRIICLLADSGPGNGRFTICPRSLRSRFSGNPIFQAGFNTLSQIQIWLVSFWKVWNLSQSHSRWK